MPGAALDALEERHRSSRSCPPSCSRLRDAGLEEPAPRLRAMLLGGGPIPPDLLEWATAQGLPARCTYGMTETCSQVVVTEPGETAGPPLPDGGDRDRRRAARSW